MQHLRILIRIKTRSFPIFENTSDQSYYADKYNIFLFWGFAPSKYFNLTAAFGVLRVYNESFTLENKIRVQSNPASTVCRKSQTIFTEAVLLHMDYNVEIWLKK